MGLLQRFNALLDPDEVWHEDVDVDPDIEEFAVWTTKYVNALPDGAFLYKDDNGRHLPYKDASGKVDLPHLRNAAARVNQIKGISDSTVSSILARIKKMLGGTQKNAETLYAIEAFSVSESDGLVWVHGFPYKTYEHPEYGKVEFTPEDAQQMYSNWTANVLGRDVAWNFDHRGDAAKGNKAAGWVKQVQVRDDGLWVGVEPTGEAMSEIQDKQWKYSSIERKREWTNPSTGETFENVLYGGAFTNYPFLHGVAPLNFSELTLTTPPAPDKEETEVDLADLAKKVGLESDATEEAVTSRLTVLLDTEQKFSDTDKNKNTKLEQFKDTEPELYAEILEGRKERQQHKAEKFADTFVVDGKQLAPKHREDVIEGHVKMQRGEITSEEFAETVREASTKGLVRISTERGSAGRTNGDNGDTDSQKLVQEFSDLARGRASEKNIPYRQALGEIAAERPELAEAYATVQVPVHTTAPTEE